LRADKSSNQQAVFSRFIHAPFGSADALPSEIFQLPHFECSFSDIGLLTFLTGTVNQRTQIEVMTHGVNTGPLQGKISEARQTLAEHFPARICPGSNEIMREIVAWSI
jgi:hypothetical protein